MKTKKLLFFSLFCKGALLIAQVASLDQQKSRDESINFSEEAHCEDQDEEGDLQAVKEEQVEKNSSPLMMFGFEGRRSQREPSRNNVDDSYNRRRDNTNPSRAQYSNRDDDTPEERDFTQRILNWRLGSIGTPLEEASLATRLALNNEYRTAYYNQFLPLILEEARAAIEKGLGERNNTFPVRVQNDVNEPRTKGNPWIMNLQGTIPEDQEHSPSMNVLLLEHSSGMKFLVLANEKEDRNELKAKFQLSPVTVANKRNIFNAGSEWKATYVTGLVTHERAYEACSKKTKPECLMRIVKARIHLLVDRNDPEVRQHIQHLNDYQQRAIQSVVASPVHSITVIKGPPGTGKTTTIVGLLRVLCDQNQRVLVCAPSNKAVQVLAERFLKDYPDIPMILTGVERKLSDELRSVFLHTWREDLRKKFSTNLNRIFPLLNPPDLSPQNSQSQAARSMKFNKDRFLELLEKTKEDMIAVESQLKKYRFQYKVEFQSSERKSLFDYMRERLTMIATEAKVFSFDSENALTLFKEHARERREQLEKGKNDALRLPAFKDDSNTIERKLLARSKIVCATLSVTGRRSIRELPSGVLPNILVVDEAGQSVEAETLIPFQHNPIKVVLAGDTKQLPATTMSQLAKDKNYDRSMMARLEENNQPTLMLETQYRMDRRICEWPSNQYYEGRLQTHPDIPLNTRSDIAQPIAFYDISSGKEKSVGTSRQNDKEAEYVLKIIQKIREKDKTSSIGVITFYAAQVGAIQKMLQRESPNIKQKVTVNTVDGFQGDEREIIILSSVCANTRKDIGFLNDPRRLNVAITRPKQTLIVLGHAQTLQSKESDLKEMISNLRGRNKFFTEQQLNQFLGNEARTAKAATGKAKAKSENSASAAAAAIPKLKQGAAPAGKKGKQQPPTEIASRIERIQNPDEYYTDDDMKDLGEMLLPRDVHYIVPALAAVPAELSQALDRFKNDGAKQQAVIAVHNENHFTGILMRKNFSNRFSIIYFDPVVSKHDGQPLHKIPEPIFQILKEKFPNVPVIKTSNEIQPYTIQGSGKKKINAIDNNHCGPFVLFVMTEMAKGNLRLNSNKSKKLQKLQLKGDGEQWIDIQPLNETESNDFGNFIRHYHATILSDGGGVDSNVQLTMLKRFSAPSQSSSSGPLETISVLEGALPVPPPKASKAPKNSKSK